jgi:hypothetical protein
MILIRRDRTWDISAGSPIDRSEIDRPCPDERPHVELDAAYRSGRSGHWIKTKNSNSTAVKRFHEGLW